MGILEKINSPADLKQLDAAQLKELAAEVREKIIDITSQTGGHVGPNMGAVELTIALHYVLNSPRDKIVWDVSHQCYTHKILTGRRERFNTLRQYKGLAGFTKRGESDYDCFGTGHASTSISAALGIAEARDQKRENFQVCAVLGDGSLSGGMAYEGLNNIGYLQTDILLVLNDNKMSISPNVGAMAEHLKRLSTVSFERQRRAIGTIFEKLGFRYFGPVDGHNIEELIKCFQEVVQIKGPKIVHVLTIKGKGYPPAEETPDKWHGLGAFDRVTGKTNGSGKPTYSKIFAHALTTIAENDPEIVAITAAMADGTGLKEFAEKFPTRFYDVGIAEEHAVTFAAGLASQGIKPAVAIYSTFLQRAFDQIIHDVALQNLPVRFFLDRCGLVGDDGPTHHGCFDLSYLRIIPNMVVMAASDENELQHMVYTAMKHDSGPISLRYPRGRALGVQMDSELKEIEIGKAEVLRKGNDVGIIAVGNMVQQAMNAAGHLEEHGIEAEVVNARFVKPLDEKAVIKSAKKSGKLITVEENCLAGGFGSAVIELLEERGMNEIMVKRVGIPDKFVEHGTQDELRKELELTTEKLFYESKHSTKCSKVKECKKKCLDGKTSCD